MRNLFFKSFIIMTLAACALGCDLSGDGIISVSDGEEVQAVLAMTNSFRTGDEAFYINKDNETFTDLRGKLKALNLDKDLCAAAEIRAREIVRKFSHTRPNGNSCFTVLDDLSIKRSAKGENIAAGNMSGEKTFLQWKEDKKDYDGQGHRRNMLGENYKRIGIAYAYAPDSTYKYYWVMILTD